MTDQTKKFQRNIEDFSCEHCGFFVAGNGYTNHCPKCLWSKHVDINPGDRQAQCGGMMRPVAVETKRGEYILVYRCETCKQLKRNKTAANDNFEALLQLEPG